MRAAPAVSLEISEAGAWRRLHGVLLSSSVAASVAWAADRADLSSAVVAVLVAGYAAGLAWRMRRARHWWLSWDGMTWSVGLDRALARRGDVAVALDLGTALLLRFVAEEPSRRRTLWLPLTRSGSPAQWHALRCALFSPRPVSAVLAA